MRNDLIANKLKEIIMLQDIRVSLIWVGFLGVRFEVGEGVKLPPV